MSFDVTSITDAYQRGDMKPAEIANHVQAMFMEVLIESMEKSVGAEGGLYGDSASSEIYRGMLRQELAMALSTDLESPLRGQIEQAIEDRSSAVPAEISALPVDGTVSSPTGWWRDPITGEVRYHQGTDIAAPAGSPIKAVAGGTIIESGEKGGYGNAVVVETDDGRKMLYAHNLENHVRVGDRVRAGEILGLVGSTGRSTGPHVHFEVME